MRRIRNAVSATKAVETLLRECAALEANSEAGRLKLQHCRNVTQVLLLMLAQARVLQNQHVALQRVQNSRRSSESRNSTPAGVSRNERGKRGSHSTSPLALSRER